jgi:hypothetical protein
VEWVAIVLVGWGALAIGILCGYVLHDRLEVARGEIGEPPAPSAPPAPAPPAPAEPMTDPYLPRLDMPDLPTTRSDVPPLVHPPTNEIPMRRVDDSPGAELRPPLPGGRRRSDGPRMTRREARLLREGEEGSSTPS